MWQSDLGPEVSLQMGTVLGEGVGGEAENNEFYVSLYKQ